jgi:hypothetical protein
MASPEARPTMNKDGTYSNDYVQKLLRMIGEVTDERNAANNRNIQLEIQINNLSPNRNNTTSSPDKKPAAKKKENKRNTNSNIIKKANSNMVKPKQPPKKIHHQR